MMRKLMAITAVVGLIAVGCADHNERGGSYSTTGTTYGSGTSTDSTTQGTTDTSSSTRMGTNSSIQTPANSGLEGTGTTNESNGDTLKNGTSGDAQPAPDNSGGTDTNSNSGTLEGSGSSNSDNSDSSSSDQSDSPSK